MAFKSTTHTAPPTTPKKKSKAIVIQSPYFSPNKPRSKDEISVSALHNSTETTSSLETKDTQSNCAPSAAWSSVGISQPIFESDHSSRAADPKQTTEMLGRLKPNLIQGDTHRCRVVSAVSNRWKEQVADDPWKLLVAVTLLNKTAGKLAIPVFYNILKRWPTPYDLSQGKYTVIMPSYWRVDPFPIDYPADESELVDVIRRLGTQNIRTKRLIAISRAYVQDPPSIYDMRSSSKISTQPRRTSRFFSLPIASVGRSVYTATPISHYPGTGRYALDSYRIFSTVCDDPGSEEWKTVLPTDKELILFLVHILAFAFLHLNLFISSRSGNGLSQKGKNGLRQGVLSVI